MVLESVGTSLIIGKARKGKFSNLKDTEIKKWYLFVAAFGIEYLTVKLAAGGDGFFSKHILLIHLTIYLLLFAGLYFNRKLWAFKIVFIGILLNFIVIMANGGHMPVSAGAMLSAGLDDNLNVIRAGHFITHSVMDTHTKLPFLGDILVLPKPYPRPKVFSIGDMIMAAGVFIFIQQEMLRGVGSKRQKTVEL